METRYLIDTSAYSHYLTKRLKDQPYRFFETVIREESLVSIISRMELESWVPGSKELEANVRSVLSSSMILSLSEPIIRQTIKLRRHYRGLKLPDAVIAATAIVHSFTLLSTNDIDFQRINELNYKSLSA